MKFSKPCDFNHFPFEIGSISEEVTLMELIELIPDLLGIDFSFVVVILGQLGKVLLEFILKL